MDRQFNGVSLAMLAERMEDLFVKVDILDDMLDGDARVEGDRGVMLLPILVEGQRKTLRLEARLDEPEPDTREVRRPDSRWDMLTGVYNRNTFCKKVTGRLAQGNNLVLTLMQVDGFDDILARYGRGAGDKVLCALADVCRGLCEANGRDMTCRMADCVFAVCSIGKVGYDMEARMRALPSPLVCTLEDGTRIEYTLSAACTGTDEVLSKVWPELYALCSKRMRRVAARGGNDVFQIACFSE